MPCFNYTISADWDGNGDTVEPIAFKTLETIEVLRKADPVFHDFSMLRATGKDGLKYVPVAELRKHALEIVAKELSTDKYGDDGRIGAYAIHASNSEAVPLARTMHFFMLVGGRYGNRLKFEAGALWEPPDPDFVTCSAFKGALVTMASIWPLPWAYADVYCRDYYKMALAPGEPPMPDSQFHIGWMAYLSAPYTAGLSPPAELISERTPGGGLLLSAVEKRLDPTRPDHLRRSRILTDFLIDRLGARGDLFALPPARIGPY